VTFYCGREVGNFTSKPPGVCNNILLKELNFNLKSVLCGGLRALLKFPPQSEGIKILFRHIPRKEGRKEFPLVKKVLDGGRCLMCGKPAIRAPSTTPSLPLT
jgi:hypothetical protein